MDEERENRSNKPSTLAGEVRRLKDVTLAAVNKREFVPQPLFWSLFHSEITKLKREREQARAISEILSILD